MKTKNFKTIITSLLIGLSLIGCKKENSVFDVKSRHFLEDTKYTSLTIEVVSVKGQEPNQSALDNLKVFLSERLNKSGGITFVQSSIESPRNNIYSAGDLRDLEKDIRSKYTQKNKLAAFIFYADQGYVDDNSNSKVLGVAYSSTSICIFKKAIKENSGGIGQSKESKLETAVLFHEFGHLMGLVNNGTPMVQDHEDIYRQHHCDNENCIMYFESKSSDIIGLLGNGDLPTFDNQCLDDLKAYGGK